MDKGVNNIGRVAEGDPRRDAPLRGGRLEAIGVANDPVGHGPLRVLHLLSTLI